MDNCQIEAFLAVAQTGNITKAANMLYISQPALSHRISTLEEETGSKLITRQKGIRNITLTRDGRSFLSIAQKMQQLFMQSKNLKAHSDMAKFEIAAVDSINSYILPKVYKRFMSRKLPVSLDIHTIHSNEAYKMVENHEISIAFIALPMYSNKIDTEPFFHENLCFICSKGRFKQQKITPDMLDVKKEIILPLGPQFSVWHDYWFGEDARPMAHIDTISLIENFIAGSDNWAVVPYFAAGCMEKLGRISRHEIEDGPKDRVCYMLTLPNDETKQYKEIFVKDMRSYLSECEGIEVL
ncbi:MAG: LysR family transcriptional regulator [Clostridia bacterium]|jgi:DNA-binding transcriptional LysR family regulator|nr:LysR family transcriptional regulator [Clostridia bacterium]